MSDEQNDNPTVPPVDVPEDVELLDQEAQIGVRTLPDGTQEIVRLPAGGS